MKLLFLVLALGTLVACGDGESSGPNPGTTGGETASQDVEPESPRDESGSATPGGGTSSPDGAGTCAVVDCQPDHTCVMVEVQCIRAPCPPQPTCVPANATCATTLCAPGTRCQESGGGARCVPTP